MRDDYALALPFDTDSPEFARGVELGRLWEQLRTDDAGQEHLIHTSNAEMALRCGEMLHRSVSSVEHDETWMTVTFGACEVSGW